MTLKKFMICLLIFVAVVTVAVFFYSFSYNLVLGQTADNATGTKEAIHEEDVINIFHKITTFKSSSFGKRYLNIINSLNLYDNAMMNFDRKFKFKDV